MADFPKKYYDLAKAIQEPKIEPIVRAYHAKIQKPYQGPARTAAPSQSQFQSAANAYGKLKHDPNSHEVQSAYGKLKQETLSHYQHLKDAGFKFHGDPVGDKLPTFHDILNHKDLGVFTGSPPPNGHPLAEKLPFNDVLGSYNNVFRAVHDVFGHALSTERSGGKELDFGHLGEDETFRDHSGLYSPQAASALATETRGQNTAFHFGPNGVHNRAAYASGQANAGIFPEQKAGLLPPEFWNALGTAAMKKSDLQKSWPKDATENQANYVAHKIVQIKANKHGKEVVPAEPMLHTAVQTAAKVNLSKPPDVIVDRLFQRDFWDSIARETGLTKNLPMAMVPPLHSTVEGFMGGLKTLPKGSPARGKLITQHMNHGPFLSALQVHPQGKQIHAMLTTHLNSQANAGFKAGQTQAMAKGWPKDENENAHNAAVHPIMQDALLEHGAKYQEHPVAEVREAVRSKAWPINTNTWAATHGTEDPGTAERVNDAWASNRSDPNNIPGRVEPSSSLGTDRQHVSGFNENERNAIVPVIDNPFKADRAFWRSVGGAARKAAIKKT